MDRVALISVALMLLAVTGVSGTDQQWPKFRGPNAGAVADDPNLPDHWSESDNVLWKAAVPGRGWSSPVVWDDHVFLTSAIITSGKEASPVPGLYDENGETRISTAAAANQRWMVYDINFQTGRIRWQRELHHGKPPVFRHIKNSYASETPVTDGERLYVYFGSLGLVAALDFNGKVMWTKDIGAFNTNVELGTGASPVLHRDRLYIVSDNTVQSFLLALDKRTGAELWKVNRDERGNWSTPVVWESALRTEIVTTGTRKVRSYDLDGNLLWKLAGMSEFTVPSPFVKHGLVYISSGYAGGALRPVYAIRPGAAGDISLKPGETSNDYVVWHQPLLGTYNTSALVYGDYYYTLLERGFLLCHDARTGTQIYGRQRISVGASGFTASPWAYNGKIFVLSEDGDTFVIQAGPEFKLLGKNSLGEMPLATPAVLRGSVLIRTASTLYRIAQATR